MKPMSFLDCEIFIPDLQNFFLLFDQLRNILINPRLYFRVIENKKLLATFGPGSFGLLARESLFFAIGRQISFHAGFIFMTILKDIFVEGATPVVDLLD